jgi:hypothetical protein
MRLLSNAFGAFKAALEFYNHWTSRHTPLSP